MVDQAKDNIEEHEIFVFGDSVMKGIVLEKTEDRYKLLPSTTKQQLEDDFQIKISNRSQFGQTISRGAALVKKIIDRNPSCKTVVLEFGGNDCDFDWESIAENPDIEHYPQTVLDQFVLKYQDLIDYLLDKKITPVLMNLPPLDPQRYFDFICRNGLSKERILNYLGDVGMIYRFQELYSHTIDKIAASTGSLLIDVRKAYLKRRDFTDLICIDGIHPSQAGHELLYDSIRNFLEENIGWNDPAAVFVP